ncbi:MAG: SDR family NAD(P)-dependent oxidoreductase [Planctomycetota bacterium]
MSAEQTGKTAMLSGSTGGIGTEIARLLAERGWNLALVNRSVEKSEQQATDLQRDHPGVAISLYQADLLDQASIVKVCKEVAAGHLRLSAIYNIAGLLTDKRITSQDGLEGHFAINTVAPYLFAENLKGALAASAQAGERPVVVNFGSSAVNSVKRLDVSSLANPAEIGGLMGAYATSKLALMAMTLAMNEGTAESGILFESVDPGPTRTTMTQSGDGMPWFLRPLVPFIFKPAEVQAKRLVDGVEKATEENRSGLYISEGKRKQYPAIARDESVQSEVMDLLSKATEQATT